TFRGRAGAGFFDSSAVHLVTTATLSHLTRFAPSSRFDPRRFRPNIVVDCDGAGEVERGWLGATLSARDVRLEPTKECRRCVITTHAQSELANDKQILATTTRETDNVVGIYAAVRAPGVISVGDELVLTR
ncbi:MAG: MOSC domain-containing protein, partial [Actinomycetota bacterium]